MTDEEKKDAFKKALLKCASGYTAVDETEEYTYKEGVPMLSKSKIVRRDVAPELAAIKLLLETEKDGAPELTEEELVAERDRLLEILFKKASS